MIEKGRRIRRRRAATASYRSHDSNNNNNASNDDNWRLQLLLIGGVLCLAITSSTTLTIGISAFPLSPTIPSQSARWLPKRIHGDDRNHHHNNNNNNLFRRRRQNQQQPFSNRNRLVYGTFLEAEGQSGKDDYERGKFRTTAARIDATVDAGSIAAMDPEYQKYKESLLSGDMRKKSNETKRRQTGLGLELELDNHNDDDSSLYKDFENFYQQNGMERERTATTTTTETDNEKSRYKEFENFYSPSDGDDDDDDNASAGADGDSKTSLNARLSPSSGTSRKTEHERASGVTETTKKKKKKKAGVIKKITSVSEPMDDTKQQRQQQESQLPLRLRQLEGFNVVLTHCTADFDSLASAVGLAKLWTSKRPPIEGEDDEDDDDDYDSSEDGYPTFVVLPRGAHPAVQRFLALHKHLFPIRSLKSLPNDLSKLHRLALVDAQRKDRIGPADVLLQHADRITVVDHHVDMESDIPGITDYVVDGVGSVSTLIVERLMRLQERQLKIELDTSSSPITTLTEAEATLLALGIHADTGSLCFDSSTPRDASALAWVMHQGASQVAIAEHAQSSLSREQQTVLTQALVNANSTVAHGVTVSTVLLTANGFINGLAAVTQDAMELSSADVFLLGVVYEPKSGRGGKSKNPREPRAHVKSKLLAATGSTNNSNNNNAAAAIPQHQLLPAATSFPSKVLSPSVMYTSELARMAEEKRIAEERLRTSFAQKDLDGNGFIDRKEMSAALVASGIIATEDTITGLMKSIDTNKDGVVDFDEFVAFANNVKNSLVANSNNTANKNNNPKQPNSLPPSVDNKEGTRKASSSSSSSSKSKSGTNSKPNNTNSPASTLIIIGRAKPGVNMKSVNLGKLLEKYGGGGHPKAASATVRLRNEAEASTIMSDLVDELIETSLREQSTVGDFMTSPVLSVKSDLSENQVEDLFNRYDVRALPVVNDENEVIGLVTYKEVSAAKQRMWNKEQKRLRQEQQRKDKEAAMRETDPEKAAQMEAKRLEEQKLRSRSFNKPTVKAWMKQHIKTVEASRTMAEVEAILLENDVGCIPVVRDNTEQLVGMVTRTDLLRQHRYYPSLHYNNKGMSDSLASRKHIVALRKKLKQFDLDE